jgi:hypothetical protein
LPCHGAHLHGLPRFRARHPQEAKGDEGQHALWPHHHIIRRCGVEPRSLPLGAQQLPWRKGATVAKSLGWGNVLLHRDAWAAGGAAVGKGARVSVGLSCMLRSSAGRADGCATVSESEWMPVGFKHMHGSRGGRAFERATVPASQWMPVECIHMLGGCEGRAHGGPTLTLVNPNPNPNPYRSLMHPLPSLTRTIISNPYPIPWPYNPYPKTLTLPYPTL